MTRRFGVGSWVGQSRGGAECSALGVFMQFRLILLVCALLGCLCRSSASTPDVVAIRHKLGQAILSEGEEQQRLLNELADSGSKNVADIINAWSRDGVYLYNAADGSKVPVILEEGQEVDGKAV